MAETPVQAGRDQTTHDFVTGLKEREELKAKLHEQERENNTLKGQLYDLMKKMELLEKDETKKRRPSNAARLKRKRPAARVKQTELGNGNQSHLLPTDKETKEMDPEKMYEEIAQRFPDLPLSTVLMAEKQFVEADTNGDGTIDLKELEHMMDTAGKSQTGSPMLTKKQVEDILKSIDLDQTNSIDFMECLAMLDLLRQNRSAGLPQTIHQQYSSNKSSVCSIQ